MLYGEGNGRIMEHTACAGIRLFSSAERSEYGKEMLTGSDSLPVPTDVGQTLLFLLAL